MRPMFMLRNLDRVTPRRTACAGLAAGALLGAVTPLSPGQEIVFEDFKRLATDRAADAEFGYAVAANGGRAIIGAPGNSGRGTNAGAAYEYLYNGPTRTWNQTQVISPSDGAAFDAFGTAVDIRADRAIIGAPGAARVPNVFSGAAYIYRYDTSVGRWLQEDRLTPSDGVSDQKFGNAVAVDASPRVAIVGAFRDDERGTEAGAAYIFRFNSGSGRWQQEQKLFAHNTDPFDRFGAAVDIRGTRAIVGAPLASQFSGTAYIYRYNSGTQTWVEEAAFGSSDIRRGDDFGNAVCFLDEQNVAVAAWSDENENGDDAGAVYAFSFNSGTSTWSEFARLVSWDGRPEDAFGASLAWDGTVLAIGAPLENNDEGAVYYFNYDAGRREFQPRKKLVASDREAIDLLGWSVAVNNVIVLTGTPWDDEGGRNAGALHGFDLLPPPPFTLTTSPNPIVGGQDATFVVTNGKPNRKTYLAYSLRGQGETFVRQLNITLDLQRPEQLGETVVSDETGRAEWLLPIAPKLTGRDIWIQGAQVEAKTNLVSQTIQ